MSPPLVIKTAHAGAQRSDSPGRPPACDLSLIVPVHNEEDNVGPLCAELREVLPGMGLDYEVIFVDDGSTDGTLEQLRCLCQDDPRTGIIELRRNYGQTAAMAAGFDHAGGKVMVPMDGDLQNDPRDIPALLTRMNEGRGYDVVSGWRRNRQDKWLSRRLPSAVANWLIGRVTGVRLHDYGCTLKAYRREILDDVHLYSELHRFLPALAAANGARVTEMVVNHRPRMRGSNKYGIGRTFRVLLDLVTVKFLGGYMTKPLYLFGKLALYVLVLALVLLGVAVGQRFGYFGQPEGLHLNRNILVALASLLAVVSGQCLVMGVMTELLVRIYHESQGRPTYQVRQVYRCAEGAGGGARKAASA